MVYVRKLASGNYQAQVRHPSGRQLYFTDPLKRNVLAWADETKARLRRGEWTDPALGRKTLDVWWAEWRSARRVEAATSDRNESQWRNHVRPAFGSWPLASITSWEVEGWVSGMVANKVGAETVASSLRLLRQLLAAAVRHRQIAANPADLVTAPKPPAHVDRFLSKGESEQLLDCFTGQDRLFVEVLLWTGLRWSEAAAIRCFRVDLMRQQVTVASSLRRDGSPKEPKSDAGTRVVPLNDSLVRGLSAHLATRPRDGLVFVGRDGAALAYTNWRRRVWVPTVAASGLAEPLPTAHDCRHTFCSWMASDGLPLKELAAITGHASTRALERYTHASPERISKARALLNADDHGAAQARH